MSNMNDNSLKPSSSRKKRWTFIQNDLKNALSTWDELEKSPISLTSEEEQLKKIKAILQQLKEKLNQF